MSDSIKELADLNTNARELLEKHSETLKSVKVVADEAKKSVKVVADEAKESVKVVADEAKESIKAFDYMEVGKPQLTTNPTKQNAIWLNLQDGSIWVCVDNTEDKNKWISEKETVEFFDNAYNTVDIFGDGSCIFYAPFNNADDELTGSYTKKSSGSLKRTSNGLLNDSKNNTNAINFKGLNLPDEFSFSAFIQETSDANTSIVTAIEFRNARPTLYCGNRTRTGGKRSISFGMSDGSDNTGVVEVTYGQRYHTVYNARGYQDADGNERMEITGYVDGQKVVNEDIGRNILSDTTQRVLLFQEGDGTDDNGWDKGFDTSQCFIGYIKNFRIFNRLLTDDEAQILSKEP